jgi:hypothetical protein
LTTYHIDDTCSQLLRLVFMKSHIVVVVVIVAATVTALNFSWLALVRLSLMLSYAGFLPLLVLAPEPRYFDDTVQKRGTCTLN